MSCDATLYIVDDDPAVVDSLSLMLKAEGYAVHTYDSARSFLAEVEKNERGCVITDVLMPGTTGLELLTALRQKGVSMPVIVISGHANVLLAVDAMKQGAVDFLQKPFCGDDLLASISEALERKNEMARQLTEAERDAKEKFAALSRREREVLRWLLEGHQNKVVAYKLGVSTRTIENHRASVMTKTQAKSLPELVQMAMLATRD